MWIRLVFAKADPGKVEEIRKLYQSQELTDFFEAQPGHRFHHLLESPTDRGDIVFLTAWASEEEMTAAFASEAHKVVGAKFKPYLVAPSERKVYEIHG
jgi:quinol monooxygenase YgiN